MNLKYSIIFNIGGCGVSNNAWTIGNGLSAAYWKRVSTSFGSTAIAYVVRAAGCTHLPFAQTVGYTGEPLGHCRAA